MSTKKDKVLSSNIPSLTNEGIELSFRTESGDRVEPAKEYIYEISKYQLFKNEGRVEIVAQEYVKSKKFIKFKDKVLGKKKDNIIEYITVSLIGAPKEYIEKNNLPFYKLQKKLKSCQRKKK